MNTSVSATGMQVKAKSNATYLLIGDATDVGTTAAALQTAALTTDGAHNTGVGKTYYPADYTTEAIKDSGENVLVAANKWYTCNNGETDSATGTEKNHKTLTEVSSTSADYATSVFSNYVLANTFCLVLTADSEDWLGALSVSVDETDDTSCVKTIVKIGSNYYEFDADGSVTINNIGISATNVITAEIFVFIDGTTDNVYTDYDSKDNLKGSVEVSFDLVNNVVTP